MSLSNILGLLCGAIFGYIVGRKLFSEILPDVSKSIKYRKMLNHLYGAIKATELNVGVCQIGLEIPEPEKYDPEYHKNKEFVINFVKNDVKKTSDCFNKVITIVKTKPTKYGNILYEKICKKCINHANILRDMYCKNFAKFY